MHTTGGKLWALAAITIVAILNSIAVAEATPPVGHAELVPTKPRANAPRIDDGANTIVSQGRLS